MEAPTTLRLRRRVGGRHLAAARQNLPGGKAVPSQNISLIIFYMRGIPNTTIETESCFGMEIMTV